MEIKQLKLSEALNKAFLKVKPSGEQIENFKTNLIQLLDKTRYKCLKYSHPFLRLLIIEHKHFIR